VLVLPPLDHGSLGEGKLSERALAGDG
jgi:hypothetical protein